MPKYNLNSKICRELSSGSGRGLDSRLSRGLDFDLDDGLSSPVRVADSTPVRVAKLGLGVAEEPCDYGCKSIRRRALGVMEQWSGPRYRRNQFSDNFYRRRLSTGLPSSSKFTARTLWNRQNVGLIRCECHRCISNCRDRGLIVFATPSPQF